MTVDYLRGNATASAIGLFVTCRHLSAYSNGLGDDELKRVLQPLRRESESKDEVGPVLSATLAVGEGIGVLVKGSSNSRWTVDESVAELIQASSGSWEAFRGELLRRIALHGLSSTAGEGKTPDLVLGLTWFLQRNPLHPVAIDWTTGPEPLVRDLGFEAISRSEQWRPFVRWAVALGLARRSNKVVIPDASTAISDQLVSLPKSASARAWLSALRERLPILGSTSLTDQLPQGPTWEQVPPSLVLGLLKLEKLGVLNLQPSDDASDVVPIGLGMTTRQVGTITIESGDD
jgi:hypothetical protein